MYRPSILGYSPPPSSYSGAPSGYLPPPPRLYMPPPFLGAPSPAAPAIAEGARGKRVMKGHNPQGIEGRVQLLRQMVRKSIEDPDVSRGLALQITGGVDGRLCPWRNDECELQAIWWFVLNNIRYTGDIDGSDTFQSARSTLKFKGGDCDDFFTLFTTLCRGNGFRAKGRITANPGGGSWAHIYPLAAVPKNRPTRWIPLDGTLGYSRFGAHPPQSRFLEFDGQQIKMNREIAPDDYEGW